MSINDEKVPLVVKGEVSKDRALLFVNGEGPNLMPSNLGAFRYIACTDGAYHRYLSQYQIVPHFIIGDLDSIDKSQPLPEQTQVIHTPNQNKTDFEKAILFLADKGIRKFDIYGASGRASDHFLGNLSVAMQYYRQYQFDFYDDYGHSFFAQQNQVLHDIKGRTVSLIPLSTVSELSLNGFKYPLINATLKLGGLVSLRNEVQSDNATISFASGDLLVFIEN